MHHEEPSAAAQIDRVDAAAGDGALGLGQPRLQVAHMNVASRGKAGDRRVEPFDRKQRGRTGQLHDAAVERAVVAHSGNDAEAALRADDPGLDAAPVVHDGTESVQSWEYAVRDGRVLLEDQLADAKAATASFRSTKPKASSGSAARRRLRRCRELDSSRSVCSNLELCPDSPPYHPGQ
jgi:hypothetical protein